MNDLAAKWAREPILKPGETETLVERWQRHQDQAARDRVVRSYMRLVVKTVRIYQSYGPRVDDLVGEGSLGLMKALDKWDSNRGVSFYFVANLWIKAYVLRYLELDSMITGKSGTRNGRRVFNGYRRAQRTLWQQGRPETPTNLAEVLGNGVKVEDVEGFLINGTHRSLEQLDDEIVLVETEETIELGLARKHVMERLNASLSSFRRRLDERELAILDGRLCSDSPMKLGEIGNMYGVSRERIRQIEAKLIVRLREHLKKHNIDKQWKELVAA